MHKKKILIIGPISIQEDDFTSIAKSLSFLDEQYLIKFIDSLSIMNDLPNQAYYQLWEQKLLPFFNEYDAFFGFSLGGIIIQQCFPLFSKIHKPLILFSTPSYADSELTKKLGKVIELCKDKQLEEALNTLYHAVFYPYPLPALSVSVDNTNQALNRLLFGLNRVLNTDSTEMLQTNVIKHTHLIGECSNLVNRNNVIVPPKGHLVTVPQASMRVLQDNPYFCQKIILEVLNNETL
jgi:hypothetical protein